VPFYLVVELYVPDEHALDLVVEEYEPELYEPLE